MAWTHDRARIARLHKGPAPDPVAIVDARRDLRVSRAEAYLEKMLAVDPPLTREQRARLASLLDPNNGTAQ